MNRFALAAFITCLLLPNVGTAADEQPIADNFAFAQSAPLTASQEDEIQRRIDQAIQAQKTKPSGPNFGYDNGFLLTSPGDVNTPAGSAFSMRINSWMQFRHTAFDSDTANRDENNFEFERLRLTFKGNVYSPDIRYFIQYDGDGDQRETSDWLDYYLTFDAGHAAGCDVGSFGLKIGKWKQPFSRARAEAGWKMAFADRSIASVFFDINRTQAIGLFGRFGFLGRDLNWETAVGNGFKTEGVRPGRAGELDRNVGVSGRLWSDWYGEWGKDGESDLSCHDRVAMRVGAGFAHTRVDREGALEFARQRGVDSGATIASLLPAAVTAYDVSFYALDANWKYRGGTLLTEYYFRSLGDFSGATIADTLDHGFLVQAGKFVIGDDLELLARWSRIVGDSGTLGGQTTSADEVAAGFVWFINGQRAKFTFDVTKLNGAPINDSSLNIRPGDDGMLYRSQFQLYF